MPIVRVTKYTNKVCLMKIMISRFPDVFSNSLKYLGILFIFQVLSSWSMLGFWSGNKLLLQNTFLLLCILWALQNKSNSSPSKLFHYAQCLKITQNVAFEFWHFPPIFVLLQLTCLVTLFDRKLQVFKNSPK